MKKTVLSSLLVIVSLLFGDIKYTYATSESVDFQLNINKLQCVDDKVEVNFTLSSASQYKPSNLVYSYVFNANQPNVTELRTITNTVLMGDMQHFIDYINDGFIDIKAASLTVNNQLVTLNNPNSYMNTYDCNTGQIGDPPNITNLVYLPIVGK